MNSIQHEFALLLTVSALVGAVAIRLHQPLLAAYLVVCMVVGPVALATGLGQFTFTILFGFASILALGERWMGALYVAVALTFSGAIIIVKLLPDKRGLDSLHGRIAVGFSSFRTSPWSLP